MPQSTTKPNLRCDRQGWSENLRRSRREHIAGYMISNDVSARISGEGESKKLNLATLFQVMRMKGVGHVFPDRPWLSPPGSG